MALAWIEVSLHVLQCSIKDGFDHLRRVLLCPLGQFVPCLRPLNPTVLHGASALLLSKHLANAWAVCPKPGSLLDGGTQRRDEAHCTLIKGHLVCGWSVHISLQLRRGPRLGRSRMLKTEQPLLRHLLQTQVCPMVHHLMSCNLSSLHVSLAHLFEIPHLHQRWEESTRRRQHEKARLHMVDQLETELLVRSLQGIPSMGEVQRERSLHAIGICSHWHQSWTAEDLHDIMASGTLVSQSQCSQIHSSIIQDLHIISRLPSSVHLGLGWAGLGFRHSLGFRTARFCRLWLAFSRHLLDMPCAATHCHLGPGVLERRAIKLQWLFDAWARSGKKIQSQVVFLAVSWMVNARN